MKVCQDCLSIFDDAVRFCPFHGVELRSVAGHTYELGESICGYYLQKKIGCDGLGSIFRATKGGNAYRLRVYSDAILCDTKRVARLYEILENDSQISGGAIPVVDFDRTTEGALYSAHPYIPGYSLRDILDRVKCLSESDTAELLLLLLRAVRDIHSQDIVHGNMSLSNMILDNSGRIRLHDTGLWDVVRGPNFDAIRDDHASFFGDIVELMSPEVAHGERALVCSDVFSCGAAACYLLGVGKSSSDASELMNERLDGEAFDVHSGEMRVSLSEDFADLLDAATFGAAGVRFQTTRAFMTALLSVHPELSEDTDALPGELCERLLSGAERVSSFFDLKAIDAEKMQQRTDELNEKARYADLCSDTPRIEHTQRGVDSDRTVVEKTRFDDLSQLVGESLEQTAVTDVFERATTVEMDPVEASPTVEMAKPLVMASKDEMDFASSLEDELFGLWNKDELQGFWDKPDSKGLSGEESAAKRELDSQHQRDSLSSEVCVKTSAAKKSEMEAPAATSDALQSASVSDEQNRRNESVAAENASESVEALNVLDGVSPKGDAKDADKDAKMSDAKSAVSADLESKKTVDDAPKTRDGADAESKNVSEAKTEAKSEAKSEAMQKAEAAEHAFEADEAAYAERGRRDAKSKPHKRIGRKDSSEAGERSDVVSMSESKELQRVKRVRLRDPQDCAPRNDVIEAETSICAMVDPHAVPPVSKLPCLTATNGFSYDEDEDDEAWEDIDKLAANPNVTGEPKASFGDGTDRASMGESCLNSGSEAVQGEMNGAGGDAQEPEGEGMDDAQEPGGDDDWFGVDENEPTQDGRRKIRLALIAVVLLAIVCVVVGIVKFSGNGRNDASNDKVTANVDAFKAILARDGEENRQKATAMLLELQSANLGQREMQHCREAYIQSFQNQAKNIRKKLMKSEELPDSMATQSQEMEIENAFAKCMSEIAENDAARAEKASVCEASKRESQAALDTQRANAASEVRPKLATQLEGWEELDRIYEAIRQQERRGLNAELSAQIEEVLAQKTAFETRLNAANAVIRDAGGMLAQNDAIDEQQVPSAAAQAEPSLADEAAVGNGMAPVVQPSLGESETDKAAVPSENSDVETEHELAPAPVVAAHEEHAPVVEENANPAPAAKAEIDLVPKAEPAPVAKAEIDLAPKAEPAPVAKAEVKTAPKAEPAPVAKAEVKTAPKAEPAPAPTPAPSAAAKSGNVPTGKLIADAQAAMGKNDFSGAVSLLQQAIAQEPNNRRAHMGLAKANERQGRWGLAARHAKTACSLMETASCYKYLGDLYTKAGMNDEAAQAYQKAK